MNPIVIVTGGSRGIGAATAILAAQKGWRVVVNYAQNKAAAESVAKQIHDAGGQAMIVQADVADEAQILRMFKEVDTHFGPVTGLVNNAGVVDTTATLQDMSWERIERMFRINVFGTFIASREALLRMSTKRGGMGGSIINVSSAAARIGGGGQYIDYAASKGAIDTFTLGLAKEVASEGVRVNAVRPGIIDTEIHASGGLPTRAKDLTPLIPMQRPGHAHEVAQAIIWLLGQDSSYTTGSFIDVAGGR